MTPSAKQIELCDFMMELSTEHFSAGWAVGLEYTLWGWLQGVPSNRGVSAAELEELGTLSAEAGGWWRFAEKGEAADYDSFYIFEPLPMWREWYAAWQEARK